MRNRTGLLAGLVFLIFLSGISAADETGGRVHFAILGDRTGTAIPGVYGEIIEEIKRLCPDFVMTVGDMIEGPVTDPVELESRWDEYDSIVAAFTTPLYFTPGNNDIDNDLMEEVYRRRIGEPYRSFDLNGLHMVILDNSRWATSEDLPQEQINWLRNDLKANQAATHILVFMHKPFWYKTTVMGKPDTLHNLFKAYGVDAVFTGHYHEYFSGRYDDILYTCVGSSGGRTLPGPTGMYYHFCWVTVDSEGINIAPIKKNAVRPWDELAAEELFMVTNMRRFGLDMEKVLVDGNMHASNQEFSITVNNLSATQAINDSLWWEMSDSWVIRPEHIIVNIPPSGYQTVTFTASCDDGLYPTPEVNFDFAYAENKSTIISSPLTICRQVDCPVVKNPPKIDGQISEDIWNSPVTEFFAADGNPADIDPVEFYFACDKDFLYLAAKCHDTFIDSLKASVALRDEAVYSDDCVGYFIQPDTAVKTAYQIYFNPNGIAFDQMLTINEYGFADGDRQWDGEYIVKTDRKNDHWSIEIAIPLAQFNITGDPGTTMGLNFRRKQPRLGGSADWQVPIDYDPKTFGLMIMR